MKLRGEVDKLFPAFLFVLADILFLYYDTSVISSPDQILRFLLLCWVILVVALYPLYLAVQNWNLAGLLLLIFSIAAISSPSIFRKLLVFLAGSTAVYYLHNRIRQLRFSLDGYMKSLSLAGVVFLLAALTHIWTQAYSIPFFEIPQFTWKTRELEVELRPSKKMPDIYYIVFDGYGREDILREYYGYDNSQFINELRKRGFVVPSGALSNYPKTALSIASTLNMDYVSNLVPQLEGREISYWWLLKPLIRDSNVRRLLEDIGYQSYSYMTGWGITENPTTDIYYQSEPIILNDFEAFVSSNTPIGVVTPYLTNFSYVPSYDDHRNLVLYNFEALMRSVSQKGPKFVFAHIVPPHPPFVFNEQGDAVNPNYPYSFNDANDFQLSDEEYRKGYISQIVFVNSKIVTLIDSILYNSEFPPIIIIQGDHGPGMMTDFGSYKNTCLHERFSVFAAYYLPGTVDTVVSNNISTVNIFRIILNEYFDAKISILPNSHYFHQNEVNLFQTDDITAQVDSCYH